MLTSVPRQPRPPTLRSGASLVASGLVLGLIMTTAGAASAQAAQAPSDVLALANDAGAVTSTLDPSFVQEGTASAHGGQLVLWGDPRAAYGLVPDFPAALPDGVMAVGISTSYSELLVLRSDGRVDSYGQGWESGPHLPAPPAGTEYTAASAEFGRLLRSDGIVVSTFGKAVMVPPADMAYTAISGYYAVRSDGALAPTDGPADTCPELHKPASGLRYTAVSASDNYTWAALRSDGALVYCEELIEGSQSTIVEPPDGTTFVGVDMGRGEALGATADGRVISTSGEQRAAAPAGRSIVSLSAMHDQQGAAVLDDGSILNWGLDGQAANAPQVPAGRAVFSAVSDDDGYQYHWAIMVGDPIPVEMIVEPVVPTGRPLRVTDVVRLNVTATLPGGSPAPGQVATTTRAPDGQAQVLEPEPASTGTAEVLLWSRNHEQVGTHAVDVTFSGTPYATISGETQLDFVEPSPVILTTSGPTTWHQGTERTLCFELATEDGSPLWWPTSDRATMSVEGHPDLDQAVPRPPWEGAPAEGCLSSLDLLPGTFTAHLDYEGWGEADSVSWTGQIVVLPPAATRVESDLPSSWRYGQMPDFVGVDVLSDSFVPGGTVHLTLDGMWFGSGMYLDENGHARIGIGHEEELVPGSYPMVVRYQGGNGFLASSLQRTVTVKPALFTTTATPTITGTAKVGAKLTASPGTWSPIPASYRYAWMVDGVAVTDATSSTFTVPAAAAGKAITVKVTGLKQHYATTSTISAPTAAVAPGTFTAPQPTITGTAKVGRTLTVSRGTWSPTPSSVTYVWKADGVTISTRTTSKFVVPASARGKRLTVTVTGSLAGYTKKSVTSAATVTVAPGTFTAPQPTIAGTTRVGSTLTVSRGTWSPAPSSVKYVWKANGTTISTRTESRFVIPAQARGKRLTVTVVGARAGYTTKSVVSNQTSEIR
jgi:hypothetical protein